MVEKDRPAVERPTFAPNGNGAARARWAALWQARQKPSSMPMGDCLQFGSGNLSIPTATARPGLWDARDGNGRDPVRRPSGDRPSGASPYAAAAEPHPAAAAKRGIAFEELDKLGKCRVT